MLQSDLNRKPSTTKGKHLQHLVAKKTEIQTRQTDKASKDLSDVFVYEANSNLKATDPQEAYSQLDEGAKAH